MSILWSCPLCGITVAKEFKESPGPACIATGRPPTSQTCLERLFKKIEALSSVLDHASDRLAFEEDFTIITIDAIIALLLNSHGKHDMILVHDKWVEPTDFCGYTSLMEVTPQLNIAAVISDLELDED